MVLPQPDSPTIPRVSPSRMEKLTPSTALVTPLRLKKYVCRSFTSKATFFSGIKNRSRWAMDQVQGESGDGTATYLPK